MRDGRAIAKGRSDNPDGGQRVFRRRRLCDVEAEIEDWGAVRDPAAGNQIDASSDDDRGSLEVDPPGGFGNGAGQAVDLAQFTSLGIDPTRYRTVAVKSMQHFRAAFEPIAREVVLVDTGALCSEIYTPELFTKVRRPVWPLDPISASRVC